MASEWQVYSFRSASEGNGRPFIMHHTTDRYRKGKHRNHTNDRFTHSSIYINFEAYCHARAVKLNQKFQLELLSVWSAPLFPFIFTQNFYKNLHMFMIFRAWSTYLCFVPGELPSILTNVTWVLQFNWRIIVILGSCCSLFWRIGTSSDSPKT